MALTTQTVAAFLGAIRSSNATPGGGSASALAGAMGASLLAMVAGLPKSRAKSEQEAARLKVAGERAAALAKSLEQLVDRDAEAYDLVLAAYRLPKGTDQEKSARSAAIQDAFRAAISAPLQVVRDCAAATEHAVVIAALGLNSASSDVQVGVELLAAAARGARLNVEINLVSVNDADYLGRVRHEIDALDRWIGRDAEAARRAMGQREA